jgi:hypothetical protein
MAVDDPRTGLSPKFPGHRNLAGNFWNFGSFGLAPLCAAVSSVQSSDFIPSAASFLSRHPLFAFGQQRRGRGDSLRDLGPAADFKFESGR